MDDFDPAPGPLDDGRGLSHHCVLHSPLLDDLVAGTTPALCCTRCGRSERMVRHGRLTRLLRDVPRDGRPTWLRLDVTRWRCGACGSTQTPVQDGLQTRRRLTQGLMDWLVQQAGQRPLSQLAREAGVDEKTVRRLARPS